MADDPELVVVVRNIDARLARVEQYLPTLATRDDLKAAFAPLATGDELKAAIVPLATHEELKAAIAPLATREELLAEGKAARLHATVLYESLKGDIQMLAEHMVALAARVEVFLRP